MTATYPIDRITLQGFKSIRRLDALKLRELNVLIGSNGAGKSNFVDFFRMLGEMVEGRLQRWTRNQGSADRIVSFGVKATTRLESTITFGPNGYSFALEPTVDGGFAFINEQTFFDGTHSSAWKSLGSGHLESKLKEQRTFPKASVAEYCYNSISGWKIFHFHDTSDTAGVKRLCALHDNTFLRRDAANLAAFLYRLAHETPEIYQRIRNVVQLAIPFFDDFLLVPQRLPSEEEQIRLLWKQKESDYPFWPSQLSDGSIRFICLVTALLQPDPPSTIIIDEPELGLHPYALALLASLLRSVSRRVQIIVSTQSVPFVNEFSVEDLLVVERREGTTTFRRHEEGSFREWLKEYSLGELWEKNLLGGRPSV
jgi:predicted ATPase